MNKRFFTLMAAVMLAGSPFAATEAFAGNVNYTATNAVVLATGVQFKANVALTWNTTGEYFTVGSGTPSEYTFTITNYSNKTFGLTVTDGTNTGVLKQGTSTVFVAKSGSSVATTTAFTAINTYEFASAGTPVFTTIAPFTTDGVMTVTDLNANLSGNGFQLNFPGLAVQPDVNLFGAKIIAVDAAASRLAYTGTGVMFVVADEAGQKLAADLTDPDKWKAASFIVVNPNKNFDITALSNAGEGYDFTTIKGEKLAADNKKADGTIAFVNGVYTVKENDQLNASEEFDITVTPKVPSGSLESVSAGTVYVGAYTLTAGGIKSYVTTAAATANVEKLTKATTAGNTYVAAVDVLKATEAPAIYNIFFQGDATNAGSATSAYGKYLVASGAKAPAYVNTDLTEAQWVVTGVGAKGAVTMTNVYDPSNTLSLKLYKTDKAGVYQASGFPGTLTGTDMIKLVPATEDEGSFLKATDSQLNREVGIAFSGSDKVTVNYIYPTIDETTGFVTATSKAAASATWYLVKHSEIEHVVNYIYLKNNVQTAGESKCKIQTYNLMDSETRYLLNDDASKVEDPTATPTPSFSTYAFKQNATGGYTAYNTTAATTYADIVTANPLVVNTNSAWLVNDGTVISPKYSTVSVDFAELGESLPAVPRYASFEGIDGGVSMMADPDGILTAVVSANPLTFWLDTAESKADTPLFYISKGIAAEEDEEAVETKADEVKTRWFLHTPSDSTRYWDPNKAQYVEISGDYQNVEGNWNAIFRPAALVGVDTLATVKNGKEILVSKKAKAGVCEGGLDHFQFAITKDADFDAYVITNHRNEYLYNLNGVLGFTDDSNKAMLVTVGEGDPTANEAIAAEAGVQVIGGQGVVTVQGAAGKVVTVANILGQTLANQVAASDNVTIAAPAGIVVVSVDGEATKVVVK